MPRGVRLNPEHDERTRAKIQTSQIINRLQSFVNGKAEMSAPQVRAAEVLLSKTLPSLSNVELTGANGGPLQYQQTERIIVDPAHAANTNSAGVPATLKARSV